MKVLTLLVLAFFMASPVFAEIQERDGDSPILHTATEDIQMNAAMAKARKTIQVILPKLSTVEGPLPISIKANIKDDKHSEHVWISNVRLVDGNFTGPLDNNPLHIKKFKVGDEISVAPEEISDWYAISGKRIHGGYTIFLARARMSAEQRVDFDKTFPYFKYMEEQQKVK